MERRVVTTSGSEPGAHSGVATIAAVGDIVLDRQVPDSAFDGVRDVLAAADLRIGNCESAYTTGVERNASSEAWIVADPRNVAGIRDAGFDALSCANNHILDGGYGGLRDTLALLHDAGIKTAGAGSSLHEACQPASFDVRGVRVSLLAYTCVYPSGFEADRARPGCATIKVHHGVEHGQPGTRPFVRTFVDPDEKRAVLEDVRAAQMDADLTIVSVHWGLHNVPADVADYERELGCALIDAGADVVFGHHQHIMKGVDVHAGKPIFHGVGNFVFDTGSERHPERRTKSVAGRRGAPIGEQVLPTLTSHPWPFSEEARKTMVLRLRVSGAGLVEASIVPCLVGDDGAPRPIASGSDAFGSFVAYLRDITDRAALRATYAVRDGEVVVERVGTSGA